MTGNYRELLWAFSAETALVVGVLAVLGIDLSFGRARSLESRRALAGAVGGIALLAALALCLRTGTPGPLWAGAVMLDPLAFGTRIGVLLLAALTLAIATGTSRTRSPAEAVAVLLLATTGFTLMAAAQQLLLGFLAIELASLSLYVLAGGDHHRPESAEAALKYFLFGGMAAAFLLFGFSLLFGLTGAIDLPQVAAGLRLAGPTPLLGVALVMVLVALGFKTAAAPFHFWAPDVYEGAPPAATALIASASKLAGFAFFARLLWTGLGPAAGSGASLRGAATWLPLVAAMSAASLLVGNFGALAQTSLRRLLAYSAIAHSGALLIGLMGVGASGPGPLFYYAATYGLATVGAFGAIAVLERAGIGDRIDDLAGLSRRSPLLAGTLLIFVLSLAGLPPLAGFFGKFAVFASVLKTAGIASPAGWLTLAAIFLSAVALYYYLLILKRALVSAPAIGEEGRIAVPAPAATALVVAALSLVLLGVLPSLVLRWFE
jgi:NADH-quinone oxidoreductase subunit N